MNEWRCFCNTSELDRELAEHIATRLQDDIATRGRASLAVSGGGTPRQMFQCLSGCELDWSRVWITLVDERWVDPDSPDSNERLVRENLLRNNATSAHFVSLKAGSNNAQDSLEEVAERLATLARPLSIVVLGMGGDGHTASWFPQALNLAGLLDPAGTAALGATDPVTAPHQRITLTLPAVLNSHDIAIHITGEEKRALIERAAEQGYPVAAVLKQATTPVTIWWAP